ncbi:LLM class flavin-dependent oxidoreductase, partial [Streptomyces sp. NPDC005799]|uniref:LLM class flavin-dependent oxidoreductase n=1 Tax=Streptomyces sp. NPDC005799 TaxID=3154678 RepID=UPI0033FE66DA
ANFGSPIPPRAQKYERADEVVQVVQALWGSWEKDAWVLDVVGKRFADMGKIQPVNLQGRHVASRGPLPIPPSEQGQPVIFQAGGGGYGMELAGRYASGVYANPMTIEDAIAQRGALRDAAKRAGRDPDEVKMFAGFMPAVTNRAHPLPVRTGPVAEQGERLPVGPIQAGTEHLRGSKSDRFRWGQRHR